MNDILQLAGLILAVLTPIAAVLWWAVRLAHDVGRIRGALESVLVELRTKQDAHEVRLDEHDVRIHRLEQHAGPSVPAFPAF